MKTLQIEESKAKELYKTASAEFKAMLEDSFGKNFFSDDWMDIWRKFLSDYKMNLVLPYPDPKNSDEEYIDAQFMMMHIIRKKRKKKPDFSNSKYKFAPYFRCFSGLAFEYSGSGSWSTYSYVGSRLCIEDDSNLMDQVAAEFLKIYEKIILEP